jgi:hypothetical protein
MAKGSIQNNLPASCELTRADNHPHANATATAIITTAMKITAPHPIQP